MSMGSRVAVPERLGCGSTAKHCRRAPRVVSRNGAVPTAHTFAEECRRRVYFSYQSHDWDGLRRRRVSEIRSLQDARSCASCVRGEGVPLLTAGGPQFDARPDHFGPDSSDLPLQDEESIITEPTLLQLREEPRASSRATGVAGALVVGLLVGQRGASLPAPKAVAAVPAPPALSTDDARSATLFAKSPAPLTYTSPTVADSSGTLAAEARAGRGSAVGPAEPAPPRRPDSVRTTGVSVDPAPPPAPREYDREATATSDPGVLQFVSRPAGAQVFVDGALVPNPRGCDALRPSRVAPSAWTSDVGDIGECGGRRAGARGSVAGTVTGNPWPQAIR